MWNMTRKCNYRCDYCYYPHDNTPVDFTLPVARIKAFLDSTGREWVIGMTGGEPFLYPGFVEICKTLTQSHIIAVDSNLSVSSKVREFAHSVDPSRVQDIYASLHIEERERTGGVDAFIRNVLLLRDNGFVVKVNYVLHPRIVDRYKQDAELFRSHGIELAPRPFKGKYQGAAYPNAYNDKAKAIFSGTPDAGKKMIFNFKGVPCHGGHTFVRLEPDGTVMRCAGDKSIIGNILGEVNLADGPEPCRVNRCPCRALDHIVLTEAQRAFVEGLQHSLVDDDKQAKAAYAKALELDPAFARAANNLGVVEWRAGQKEQAREHFKLANELTPQSNAIKDNFASASNDDYPTGQTILIESIND